MSPVELWAGRAQYLQMKAEEDERLIAHAVTRLTAKYPPVSADVADAVVSAHAQLDGHKGRDLVPLPVERVAGEKLSLLIAA